MLRKQRGLTLLELLIVIIILGLIGVVGSLQVVSYLGRAKTDTAKLLVDQLSTALDLYRIDVGRLPSTDEGLTALIDRPDAARNWNGPYLKKRAALSDPWGRAIQYRQPGEHGEFDLFSFGADGRPGGDGEDKDVTNW